MPPTIGAAMRCITSEPVPLPIMYGSGTGSEVMQRIAAPMVGGMITAPLLSMLVIPAAYLLIRRRKLEMSAETPTLDA